jgi:hypothetical protein
MSLSDSVRLFDRLHVLQYRPTWSYAMATGSMRTVNSGLFGSANVAVFAIDVTKEALGSWVRRRRCRGGLGSMGTACERGKLTHLAHCS